MNQVIIAKQLVTGDVSTLLLNPFTIGFSTDGKTLINTKIDTNCFLYSSLLLYTVGDSMKTDIKAIDIPKNRSVSLGTISDGSDLGFSATLTIVENEGVDFNIIVSNDVPNDYKYSVYVDKVYTSDMGDYMENYVMPYVYPKLEAAIYKIRDKGYYVEIDDVSVDDESNEGDNTVVIRIRRQADLNLKVAGKNIIDTTSADDKYFISSDKNVPKLIDKYIQQFGINHREQDNSFYNKLIEELNKGSVQLVDLTSIVTLRFKNPRVASVTHDEDLYQTVHILTNEATANKLSTIFDIS